MKTKFYVKNKKKRAHLITCNVFSKIDLMD